MYIITLWFHTPHNKYPLCGDVIVYACVLEHYSCVLIASHLVALKHCKLLHSSQLIEDIAVYTANIHCFVAVSIVGIEVGIGSACLGTCTQ